MTSISALVLKTHGTPVASIDCVAAHGFCMAESTRYKREQYFVELRLDRHLMFVALRAAAIPWDKCDFQATMAVTGGTVHVCAVTRHFCGCGNLVW